VVSIEVNPLIAEAARSALTRARYSLLVITGDGADGYPNGAPYDRVLATAAVREIVPHAWLGQTQAHRSRGRGHRPPRRPGRTSPPLTPRATRRLSVSVAIIALTTDPSPCPVARIICDHHVMELRPDLQVADSVLPLRASSHSRRWSASWRPRLTGRSTCGPTTI
jgi:Protein-L-isoaspartate(D-aspartate) O-methyltransferase (PCMT)